MALNVILEMACYFLFWAHCLALLVSISKNISYAVTPFAAIFSVEASYCYFSTNVVLFGTVGGRAEGCKNSMKATDGWHRKQKIIMSDRTPTFKN